ncbi:MAG TPA: hypothetical protein VK714_19550 [Myxococcota bacterium]|nr:hypothetical protein [Myxococcota bacterium]
MKSATGNRFHGNQPDWDYSRAHDTGWQAWLNPGHPGWRETLCEQIEALAAGFGFDGVFLDTVHVWINDPDCPVYDGVRALVQRLRERIPGVLLAAEHDYDALLPLFPLFQCAYWGRDPGWTARYVLASSICARPSRKAGPVCMSSACGKRATTDYTAALGYLPTLAFQHDTLERSRAQIEATLAMIAAR